ncbi:MAG: electron transfer flavoprotein subunit beta/FixA family protein [Acidobacteria bacterium]|nr:electron transfer flavoprotein subunit beta/FixA family protein [Acidobacteriota bacterium]
MKIIVCLKQVPARDSVLRIDDAQAWVRETDLSFEINEPDTYALEEGLRLKEKHGGEVVVVCAGPARAASAIREALAKGADRGIHIEDEALARLDSFTTARALAAAIRAESFDLVLTGLQSDDLGFSQTGVILAELLGAPHATIIMEVQKMEGGIKVKRELEAGWFQYVEMPLPALLAIQSGINKVRYATLMGIKKAKTKELKRVTPAELGVDLKPRQIIRRVYAPQKSKQTQFLEGPPKEVAAKLLEKLKFEARVL